MQHYAPKFQIKKHNNPSTFHKSRHHQDKNAPPHHNADLSTKIRQMLQKTAHEVDIQISTS